MSMVQKSYTGDATVVRQTRNSGSLLKTKRDAKLNEAEALERESVLKALVEARNEWLDAVACFENAYEEELVDYYTYKMKACEARYTYFIKQAKEMGLASIAADIASPV